MDGIEDGDLKLHEGEGYSHHFTGSLTKISDNPSFEPHGLKLYLILIVYDIKL